MVQRSKRHLAKHDAEALLKELEAINQRLCSWLARAPIGSPIYVALDGTNAAMIVSIKAARHEADMPEFKSNRY
jgi:antitoxin (DNA-binding transcriptional repressor) of toxin-antitoxin stability system